MGDFVGCETGIDRDIGVHSPTLYQLSYSHHWGISLAMQLWCGKSVLLCGWAEWHAD